MKGKNVSLSAETLHKNIAKVLFKTNLPFLLVENKDFQGLLYLLNSNSAQLLKKQNFIKNWKNN